MDRDFQIKKVPKYKRVLPTNKQISPWQMLHQIRSFKDYQQLTNKIYQYYTTMHNIYKRHFFQMKELNSAEMPMEQNYSIIQYRPLK